MSLYSFVLWKVLGRFLCGRRKKNERMLILHSILLLFLPLYLRVVQFCRLISGLFYVIKLKILLKYHSIYHKTGSMEEAKMKNKAMLDDVYSGNVVIQ